MYELMLGIFDVILSFGIMVLACILWHEVGHLIFLSIYNRRMIKLYYNNWAFEAGRPTDYILLTKTQKITVIASGILTGLIPMIFITDRYLFLFVVMLYYIAGCRSDIIFLYQTIKRSI